jgi:lipopolysaccharide export system permease protein
MDTLDRYLIREFLTYFFLILFGLAAIFLGIDFLTKFWDMNMPIGRVFALYGYKLPAVLQRFLPVACLMATLLVLSGMSRQNEILALYASGVSVFRIVSTFIAIAAVLSTISFLLFDSLVPVFAKREMLVSRGLDPSQDYPFNTNHSGFWYRSGRIIYNVAGFTPETNTLDDVHVFVMSPTFDLVQMVHAKRARYHDSDWELQDGVIINYPPKRFPVSSTFTSKHGVIPEKPSDYKSLKVEDDTMRLRDLRRFILKNRSFGLDTTGQQVNYHQRLALVFTPLIFVLLAISFSTKPVKTQSFVRSIGLCFLVVFIYLLMFQMVLSVGKGGHIPPVVAGWATNVVFLLVAMILLMRR